MTSVYVIDEKFSFEPRRLKVGVIGCGISGIYLGIRIPQVLQNIDLTIYEKNPSVTGTWYENKYPGCKCDVPSHRYAYTFEPNPDWPEYYSPSDSIEEYYAGVANKYNVLQYVKLNTAVTEAKWDEESGTWKIKVQGPDGTVQDDYCNILINATGVLNSWKWPVLPGLHDFKGTLLHTAKYNRSIVLEGKKVAVIGSGSSAIQVVTSLQPVVKQLDNYIRSPTWIVPPFNMDAAPKNPDGTPDFRYSPEMRQRFKDDPEYYAAHRKELELSTLGLFDLLTKGTKLQETVRATLTRNMKAILDAKPGLSDKMIPNFAVGCRRVTPGIGYLEALVKDNVECIFGSITKITEKGVVDAAGVEHEYDAIICATGFDVSFQARFPFIGRKGRQLDATFGDDPKAYMSLAVGGFPNYFVFNGPASPVGNGAVIPAIETEGEYMIKCIHKMQTQDIKAMCIKDEVIEEFVRHADAFMPRMVWTDNCRSWYKNGKRNGRVTALWPGSAHNFNAAITDPRFEDYDFVYTNPLSRFSYLGFGKCAEEQNADYIAGYLERKLHLTEGHPALAEKQLQCN